MGRIVLRVQPGAKRRRIVGKIGAEWKIAVAAPPLDGKANRACIEYLAEICDIAKSGVTLVAGAASRRKVFELEGYDTDAIERRLAALS